MNLAWSAAEGASVPELRIRRTVPAQQVWLSRPCEYASERYAGVVVGTAAAHRVDNCVHTTLHRGMLANRPRTVSARILPAGGRLVEKIATSGSTTSERVRAKASVSAPLLRWLLWPPW